MRTKGRRAQDTKIECVRNILDLQYGDAFENDFRARLGVMMKIHSRFIAQPLNQLIHVESFHFQLQSMRTVGKMCPDLAIGVLRALFEKAPVRQGRFGAKFAKRQLFFDTQIFLFRIQKVIFGIHTAVRQGFNVGFCQSKCSVVFSFGVFSSTFQVGPIDHCQRPVKHTNCLPVTFTRAKLVRP